jgi:hypothetical protein
MTTQELKAILNKIENAERVLNGIDTVSDFNFFKLVSQAPLEGTSSAIPEMKQSVKDSLNTYVTNLKAFINA